MAEFDEVAYNAASELFHLVKRTCESIPSLEALEKHALDMLGAQRYDGNAISGGGGNRFEEAVIGRVDGHESLGRRISEEKGRYAVLVDRCESAIADMEAHMEGDALDSCMLRYYFMMDKDVPEVRRLLKRRGKPYSESYLYQKKEIALVRVAAAVRRLHLI